MLKEDNLASLLKFQEVWKGAKLWSGSHIRSNGSEGYLPFNIIHLVSSTPTRKIIFKEPERELIPDSPICVAAIDPVTSPEDSIWRIL